MLSPAPSGQLHDAVPPEPAPAKIMKTTMVLPDNPHGRQPKPAAATGHPAPLPVQPKKAWLTPPEEWQPEPGEGLLDKTPLYSFTTVATTPHNSHRDMSGMDIRDVRLVQVIHGGVCTRTICDMGRISHPHRGLTLEYLFEAPAPIPAPELAHFGKGPRRINGPQH